MVQENANNIALIFGATGITGRAVMTYLCSRPRAEWPKIYAVTSPRTAHVRLHPHPDPAYQSKETDDPHACDRIVHITCDLTDEKEVHDVITRSQWMKDITHVFYNVVITTGNAQYDSDINNGMFRNVLNALAMCESGGTQPYHLKHVVLQTGTQVYGEGPYPKLPITEDFADHVKKVKQTPKDTYKKYFFSFQHDQETMLVDRFNEVRMSREKLNAGPAWSYSIVRPHTIIGFGHGNFMSFATSIAAYAWILKKLGKKLLWPGSTKCWKTTVDATDANILARFQTWLATCSDSNTFANESFNCVNGDYFKWCDIWPQIAKYFNMEWEGPSESRDCEKNCCQEYMNQLNAPQVWKEIASQYQLAESDLKQLVTFDYVDATLHRDYDILHAMDKATKYGWKEKISTGHSFERLWQQMEHHHFLPPCNASYPSGSQ